MGLLATMIRAVSAFEKQKWLSYGYIRALVGISIVIVLITGVILIGRPLTPTTSAPLLPSPKLIIYLDYAYFDALVQGSQGNSHRVVRTHDPNLIARVVRTINNLRPIPLQVAQQGDCLAGGPEWITAHLRDGRLMRLSLTCAAVLPKSGSPRGMDSDALDALAALR